MPSPPPALDCAHAIEYAIVDDTVTFEQRHTLNVGGLWLGQVANLAICRNLEETQLMVFHCDSEWNVLGVAAGYTSTDEAKATVERSYHGLASKWLSTGYSREQAADYVAQSLKGLECSFCGKTPLEYEAIAGNHVRVCNHCVDEFHREMHRGLPEI